MKKIHIEIAGLIKDHPSGESQSNNKTRLAHKLSKCLEDEAREVCFKENKNGFISDIDVYDKFNPNEFLKLCGVEKLN